MRKETPQITICDEIDIKLFSEAEQNAFYNALLTRIIDLFHDKNKEYTLSERLTYK